MKLSTKIIWAALLALAFMVGCNVAWIHEDIQEKRYELGSVCMMK